MKFNIDKSNWSKVRFGDIAIQQKENVDRETTELKRYIAGEHMATEDLHLRTWGEINGDYLGPAFHRKFEIGDILYGSRRTYLRKVAVAHFDGITANTTFVIKANENYVIKELVPFIMLSENFAQHSIKNSKGSVNPYINWKDIANYEFLLPPKDQQAKIAELLWAADEVIESLLIHKKNLLVLYDTLIEKELLAKDGEKQRLSEFGKVIRGVTYKPEYLVEKYDDEKCLILRANNISDGYLNYDETNILSTEKVKKEQFLQAGDFAICMANGSKELVGKAALYEDINKNVSVGSFCSILRSDSKRGEDLLKHLFASKTYRLNIKRTISGSNINNLKPSDLENIEFRISKNVEELKIIEKLNSILTSINSVNGNIEDTRKLLKTFVNKIFI